MISVFGSNFGEEEIAAAGETIQSQWVGMGSKVEAFEAQFARHLNTDDFLLVDSGSNALYLALVALELPPNSEVILPSFTWVACVHAVLLAGHQPVFCDVALDSQNITRETITPHITNKTKAIMVVHYAGKPVDINPILELGFPVIEDAAHAVDSKYHGKACGTLGAIGMFSFDPVKNLAMGEGGGLSIRDADMMNRARRYRYSNIGKSGFQKSIEQVNERWWEFDIGAPFIKMLPTDLEASIGLVQLNKLSENQERRGQIWKMYQEAFESVKWIKTPLDALSHETHSFFTYLIRVPKRDQLALYLLEHNIYTTLRYSPLHLNNEFIDKRHLPNSEQLNEVGLNIPLHPRLSDDDVQYIIDKILSFGNS